MPQYIHVIWVVSSNISYTIMLLVPTPQLLLINLTSPLYRPEYRYFTQLSLAAEAVPDHHSHLMSFLRPQNLFEYRMGDSHELCRCHQCQMGCSPQLILARRQTSFHAPSKMVSMMVSNSAGTAPGGRNPARLSKRTTSNNFQS